MRGLGRPRKERRMGVKGIKRCWRSRGACGSRASWQVKGIRRSSSVVLMVCCFWVGAARTDF